MRLAIVEPDPALADVLAFAARRRGHQTVCVTSADRLLEALPFTPSVAVISLGQGSGAVDSLLQVRQERPDLVLLITVEEAPEPPPQLLLQAGAQDVIRIPYNPYQVVARAEAWERAKSARPAGGEILTLADIEVDLEAFAARKNGKDLELTKLELRLVHCLCEHHPNVAPLERLLSFGWEGMDDPDASLLKTHISHIRHKLGSAGGEVVRIASRQAIGYRIELSA